MRPLETLATCLSLERGPGHFLRPFLISEASLDRLLLSAVLFFLRRAQRPEIAAGDVRRDGEVYRLFLGRDFLCRHFVPDFVVSQLEES